MYNTREIIAKLSKRKTSIQLINLKISKELTEHEAWGIRNKN
jgi:hypothetical protein